jgi:predicted CoA-binding protein
MVAEALLRIPANIDVISIMRNTAKVTPVRRPANFARSFTRSL